MRICYHKSIYLFHAHVSSLELSVKNCCNSWVPLSRITQPTFSSPVHAPRNIPLIAILFMIAIMTKFGVDFSLQLRNSLRINMASSHLPQDKENAVPSPPVFSEEVMKEFEADDVTPGVIDEGIEEDETPKRKPSDSVCPGAPLRKKRRLSCDPEATLPYDKDKEEESELPFDVSSLECGQRVESDVESEAGEVQGGALDPTTVEEETWEPEFVFSRDSSVWFNKEVSDSIELSVIPEESLVLDLNYERCAMNAMCSPSKPCTLHKRLKTVVDFIQRYEYGLAYDALEKMARGNGSRPGSTSSRLMDVCGAFGRFMMAWKHHFYYVKHYLSCSSLFVAAAGRRSLFRDACVSFASYAGMRNAVIRVKWHDLNNAFHRSHYVPPSECTTTILFLQQEKRSMKKCLM